MPKVILKAKSTRGLIPSGMASAIVGDRCLWGGVHYTMPENPALHDAVGLGFAAHAVVGVVVAEDGRIEDRRRLVRKHGAGQRGQVWAATARCRAGGTPAPQYPGSAESTAAEFHLQVVGHRLQLLQGQRAQLLLLGNRHASSP